LDAGKKDSRLPSESRLLISGYSFYILKRNETQRF
jgi:hypothetical protein